MTKTTGIGLGTGGLEISCGGDSAFGIAVLITVTAFFSPVLALCLSTILFAGNPSRKMAASCAFGIAVSMALITSGIEYRHPVDVTRWMAECQFYTGKDFLSVLSSSNADHDSLIVWNVWCWLVGNSGNLALLQVSGSFVGFGLTSWVVMDACARERTDTVAFIALFIFVVLAVHMQAIVAYMRSTLGCILCATAFYIRRSYGVKDSILSLLLILLACGIHTSMVVAFALFILQPFIAKNPKSGALICALALAAVASAATFLITSHVLDGLPLVGDAIRKASVYTEGTGWDQQQAKDSLAVAGHVLSMILLGMLLLRTFLTSQDDYRFPVMLVMSFCVFAMEATLVNVGNRLIYIPLLIGSTLCLNNEERKALSKQRWPLLLDLCLFVVAALVCLLALRDFVPSFNYIGVAKYAVFYPSILF